MKIRDIVRAEESIAKLVHCGYSPKQLFKLRGNVAYLMKELEDFGKFKEGCQKKYFQRDENGDFKRDEDRLVPVPGGLDKFKDDVEEVLEEEVTLPNPDNKIQYSGEFEKHVDQLNKKAQKDDEKPEKRIVITIVDLNNLEAVGLLEIDDAA